MSSGPRLVSFLGTGPYKPVRYVLDDRIAEATPWVVLALSLLTDPPPADIRLVVTPQSEPRAAHVGADLVAHGLPHPSLIRVSPAGDPAALWAQFEALKEALRAPPGVPVILDITHGFRSQPFFAAAVVAFLRAVDPDPPPLRVLYGAFEARDPQANIAPIWELTAFVDLLDWTREIMLFLKTGRAAEVAGRTEALDRALRKVWVETGNDPAARHRLDPLAKALEAFGADLETIRTGALLLGDGRKPGSAGRLLTAVGQSRAAVASHAPPLADVLDRIGDLAAPLPVSAGVLNGPEGQAALLALARLYQGMARYAEAATTVREAWVCRFAADGATVPGGRSCVGEAREEAEKRWFAAQEDSARAVSAVRNDIDHGGFRRQPLEPKALKGRIDCLIGQLAGAPTVFANISNHPHDRWADNQRRAALDRADRIEDVPFPAVPPDLSTDKLAGLAKDILARLPPGTTHALVQGEFTLTFAIVRELQKRGVICLAATGERDVEQVEGSATLRRFAFASFREFAV